MEKFKIDLKTAITLGTLLFVGAGFYYTTELRLKDVETEISWLQGQIRLLKTDNKRLNKLIRNRKNTKRKGSNI
jgi:hypothetical protein